MQKNKLRNEAHILLQIVSSQKDEGNQNRIRKANVHYTEGIFLLFFSIIINFYTKFQHHNQ